MNCLSILIVEIILVLAIVCSFYTYIYEFYDTYLLMVMICRQSRVTRMR